MIASALSPPFPSPLAIPSPDLRPLPPQEYIEAENNRLEQEQQFWHKEIVVRDARH